MAARIWRIELLVESDDVDEIDRLSEEVERLACDDPSGEDHTCRVPWFIITSPLDDEDGETWRGELNR